MTGGRKRSACQTALGVVLCLLGAAVATAVELPRKLVSADWLQENLNQPELQLIDVRPSIKDYWQGHIPGAVFVHPEALRWPEAGVPGKVMPLEAFTELLGTIGCSEQTLILVYSSGNNFDATYFIWALDYVGHRNAGMLDGGFSKWEKGGKPVTQDYPRITPKDYPLPSRPHEEVRASLEEVKEAVSKGTAVLLDVRPQALYTGEQRFWKRKGHIKGAVHHFWGEDLDEEGSWKPTKVLKKVYEQLGVTSDKTIITSCGQGQMSSHTYFTLRYLLGYARVENYDGSFNEWSQFPELPLETGNPQGVTPVPGK